MKFLQLYYPWRKLEHMFRSWDQVVSLPFCLKRFCQACEWLNKSQQWATTPQQAENKGQHQGGLSSNIAHPQTTSKGISSGSR